MSHIQLVLYLYTRLSSLVRHTQLLKQPLVLEDLGLTYQFELEIKANYSAVSFHRQLYRHPCASS